MKLLISAVVAAASLVVVTADCPNACSGHGVCSTEHDFCTCYEGFTGADCSLRVCPFAQAFIDLPQGDLDFDNALNSGGSSTVATAAHGVPSGHSALNPDWKPTGWWERHPSQLYGVSDQVSTIVKAVRVDEGHFYAECAGAGICDRSTGQCSCFPGFGGAGCNRTVCPNDCSGHGICRTTTETLPAGIEWYRLWDADKLVHCVCDGGYSGLDCSERTCPRGDDPLTTTTTRLGYNKGLTETAEVQYVDVRCRYGGTAINPKITLTYMDSLTGDSYSTSTIDLSSATDSTIMAALKNLPNEVLSDYVVDGITLSARVTDVTLTELETDNRWRIAVTFNEALGDVPMLTGMASSDFLCKDALNVQTNLGSQEIMENVAAVAVGDGPNKKLVYEVRITPAAGADTADFRVLDGNGDPFDLATYTALTIPNTGDATSFVMTGADSYDRQAILVKFLFQAADGTDADDIRQGSTASPPSQLIYHLTYDPFPQFIVTNPVADLTSSDFYWRSIVQVEETSNGTRVPLAGDPLWFDRPTDLTPAYDMKITVRNAADANTTTAAARRAELLIDDEHIGFVNGTFPTEHSGVRLEVAIGASQFRYRVPAEFTSGVPAVSFVNRTQNRIEVLANSSFIAFTPKDPIVVPNYQGDSITVAFRDDEAVNMSLVLVIKIVDTYSSPDTYAWKFAGDSSFNDNSGSGFSIPNSGFVELGGWRDYLNAQPDEARRWMASRILLQWNNGQDWDRRVPCTTAASYYYVQIGKNGLNDRPVCAGRGLCDSSSGLCNCFAGYTGADCAEQNALARGFLGRSSA